MKTSVCESLESIEGGWHLESSMDAGMVVVMNMLVNGFNEMTNGGETVEVAKFMFKAAKERFAVTILPRGSHGTYRDLHSLNLEKVGTALRHKFGALIRMKNSGTSACCQGTAHHLPLADNFFDLVLASFGLNATNPRQTFPELHRILHPNGRLCFQEWGGQHQFDKLIFDTLSEYAVDDEEAPDELIALRDFFMEERPWYRDLQTTDDFVQDLVDYGFADVTAREYRPLDIELPFEVFLRYKLSWTGPRAELTAMESGVRGDCMDKIRQLFAEYIDSVGNIIYDPLIIRVQAWKS